MLFYIIIPAVILLLFLPINFFVRAENEQGGAKISLYLYGVVLLFSAAYLLGQEGLRIKRKREEIIPYSKLLKPDTKNLYLVRAVSVKELKIFVQVPLVKTKSVLPSFSLMTAASALGAISGGKVIYKQQYTLFEQGWEATTSFSTSLAKIILTIIKKVIKNGRKQTNTANS